MYINLDVCLSLTVLSQKFPGALAIDTHASGLYCVCWPSRADSGEWRTNAAQAFMACQKSFNLLETKDKYNPNKSCVAV